MEPIRILHVIGSLNSGGSQAMVMNFYRNIDRKRIQFDFIIDRPNELFYADEIKNLGGKIYILKPFTLKNIIRYKMQWKPFFKSHEEYKIIHGHIRSTASIYLHEAKKCDLITISHSHSTSNGKGLENLVKSFLQYFIRYTTDYFFSCSQQAGRWLFGEKLIHSKRYFLLKNAIDTKVYQFNPEIRDKVRKDFGWENSFVIGHVGRFDAVKNHEFIIDVFRKIYGKNHDAKLLLIGDGILKKEIQNKVDNLGLHNQVIFTGVRNDVADFMQAMDCFLFPSLYEGIGIVVIEAQASGLKVVCSDVIPREAKITENLEFISLNKTSQEWAEKILAIESQSNRESMYEKIVNSGFDIKVQKELLQKLYVNMYKKRYGNDYFTKKRFS